MKGMLVSWHNVSTGGRGDVVFSKTIRLPAPASVIAEVHLATFDTASASFGTPITAYAVFTACVTDGSNVPLPPVEVLSQGSLSGPPTTVLIRNGLSSLTYEVDVSNSSADIVINIFLWPSVVRN